MTFQTFGYLGEAEFRCVACGNSGHADVHAAMNIDERAFGKLVTCRPDGRSTGNGDIRCQPTGCLATWNPRPSGRGGRQ